MFQECGEKHSLARCDPFKKLSPQQRLKRIEDRELCRFCYRHMQGRECWSQGRVPNCDSRRLRGLSSSPTARCARGGPLHNCAGDWRQEGAGSPVPRGRESGCCRQG